MINKQEFSFWTGILLALGIFVKMMFFDVTLGDALSVLFVMAAIQAARIIDYQYPERPDIYKDVLEAKEKLARLESDVTALKFGNLRK